MWQVVVGFGVGVYVGTYYDCKPAIHFVLNTIKSNIPEKKDSDSESK